MTTILSTNVVDLGGGSVHSSAVAGDVPGTFTFPAGYTVKAGDVFVNTVDETSWISVPDPLNAGLFMWQALGGVPEIEWTDSPGAPHTFHIGTTAPVASDPSDVWMHAGPDPIPTWDPTGVYAAGDAVIADDGLGNPIPFNALAAVGPSATLPDQDAANWQPIVATVTAVVPDRGTVTFVTDAEPAAPFDATNNWGFGAASVEPDPSLKEPIPGDVWIVPGGAIGVFN